MDAGIAADDEGNLFVHGAEDNPIRIRVSQDQANAVRALTQLMMWGGAPAEVSFTGTGDASDDIDVYMIEDAKLDLNVKGFHPNTNVDLQVSSIDQLCWEDGVVGSSPTASQIRGIDGHTGKETRLTIHRDQGGNRLATLIAASLDGQGLRIQVAGPALCTNKEIAICVSESALTADSIKVEPKNGHLRYLTTSGSISPEEIVTRRTSAAGFAIGRVGNKVAHGKELVDQLAQAASTILPDGSQRLPAARAMIDGTVRTGVRNGQPVAEFHVARINDPFYVAAQERARATAREWARPSVTSKIRDMIGL